MQRNKVKVAIATGDPAGIGPEISLKAAIDPAVREACHPIIVSNASLIERNAKNFGIRNALHVVSRVAHAEWSDQCLNVLDCEQAEAHSLAFGPNNAVSGRASIAFLSTAVRAALAGAVDAVVAAPQNETSIALAGIKFDGHPSFVARETGTDADNVYLMLCFGDVKVTHCTLHQSVRNAIASITREKVARVISVTDSTLKRMGVAKPKIAVSSLNPPTGKGNPFGREEIEIIKPAIEDAVSRGIIAAGPYAADALFEMQGFDAFVVMLHDQGHVPAKLLAPNATIALTIGTPILFSSVAHGSAHDIAGKGVANPQAMIEAILHLSKTKQSTVAVGN